MALARQQGCAVVNLSAKPASRLLFPRVGLQALEAITRGGAPLNDLALDPQAVARALEAELQLGYMVPSGRYWEAAHTFDKNKLQAIDNLWLAATASLVSA
jgi:hypothetical protein